MAHQNKYVIFGPPASGKGTFCKRAMKLFPDIVHISTGSMFRRNIRNKTKLGKKVKKFIDKGKLVPNKITNQVLKARLEEISGTETSWILDGYPRTIEQAKFLNSITEIDLFILLDPPREILKDRILGRFKCSNCRQAYNKNTGLLPEKQLGENKWICDKCGSEIKFRQRSDDNVKTLLKRLELYEKCSKPVINYYEQKDKVKRVKKNKVLELSKEEFKAILEINGNNGK